MASPVSSPTRPLLVLAAIAAAAIGLGLRGWHVFSEPLWLDEAYSTYAADGGFRFLWTVVPRYESHPPFYYTLLHLWSLATGETLASRRLIGLICGAIAVVAAALATLRLARFAGLGEGVARWLGVATLAFTACHPLLIEMSRQVRPYPLMVAIYAGCLHALISLAQARSAGLAPRRATLAWFVLGEATMVWLHDLGPFYAAALSLALALVVVDRRLTRRDWWWLTGGQVLLAIVAMPAMLITLFQARSWVAATWLQFVPSELPDDLGGIYVTWGIFPRLAALALAIAGATRLLRSASTRRIGGALITLAILPALLSIAASFITTPVFLARTLSPIAIPGALLIALGLPQPARRWRMVTAFLFGGIMLFLVHTAIELRAAGPQQDWYRVLAWLDARRAPSDPIWAYPNETALPLDAALRDRGEAARSVPIPGPMPVFDAGVMVSGNRGARSLRPFEADRLAASAAAHAPRTIWLVQLGPQLFDPTQIVARALERDRIVTARLKDGPILVLGLSARRAAPAAAAAAR